MQLQVFGAASARGALQAGFGQQALVDKAGFWRYLRSAAIWAAITASSDCAMAMSMSLLAFFSASSAAALASLAFSSSRSLPRMAVSDSTVTRSAALRECRRPRRRTLRRRRPFRCAPRRA
jgi:hypothetical protein